MMRDGTRRVRDVHSRRRGGIPGRGGEGEVYRTGSEPLQYGKALMAQNFWHSHALREPLRSRSSNRHYLRSECWQRFNMSGEGGKTIPASRPRNIQNPCSRP
ncbi:hypothetical protein E2C01_001962 [Portunus trituberculatus]|uniref:Uncharacterized protein n=1 Tax=Portunus trituberculatus TaxID=210409 RepID=A0A5B7CP18_PORTR|nr:hypothetical protein [Portunus trituberculatus]